MDTMLCRLATLTLLGAVAACNPPPPQKDSIPPAVEEKAPVLSAEQVQEHSERCAKVTGEQFRRDWKDGNVPGPDGKTTADFTSHYNAKMDTCFYLLTVRHFSIMNGQDGTSADTLSKFLFDIKYDEKYGEYLGPAIIESPKDRRPTRCRIDALYCASEGEWNVLARPYMQE